MVFIGWSGSAGLQIAEALKTTFLDTTFAAGWVSSRDIQHGRQWLDQLEETLDTAEHAIVCLTPWASEAPWINFEAGIVFGRLREFTVLKVGGDIPPTHPFKAIQALDGRKKDDLKRLMSKLIDDEKMATAFTDSRWPEWDEKCREVLEPLQSLRSVTGALESIQGAVRQFQSNIGMFANPLFRFVVERSLDSISRQLNGVVTAYSVPANLYPEYLSDMQSKLKPIVRAVALLEQEELFWRGSQGKRILDTVPSRDCERVFAIVSERQLHEFMPTLLQHAHKYPVSILPYAVLRNELPSFCKDFAIIQSPQFKVLASYVDHGPSERNVQFSIDAEELAEFEQGFDKIRTLSQRVEDTRYTRDDVAQLWTRAETSLTDLQRRTVEMSTYITSIHDYDQHEEKHAYFVEMMAKMLEFLPVAASPGTLRVLELGAGTGIFTRRLAAHPSIGEIVAVEFDWACCHTLKHNVQEFGGKVKVEYHDSRTFNPEGVFDVIVSSFADHHIRKSDRDRYFKNVLRNLKPGAPFLVGDEFLREHDTSDEESRKAALLRYHGHIIDIAKSQNEQVLVRLEQEALESGLHRIGDFKVSCGEYEQALHRAGLKYNRFCIGPPEPNDVGGVCVYLATCPA